MQQKIILVTGKGGVGKSSVAAALALKEARKGRRVLLVELGERSYFADLLSQLQEGVTYEPQSLTPQLDVALWDGETCLREYLFHYIPLKKVVNLFFENPVMKSLVRAAPALKELAILGKATSGLRKVGPAFEYEVIVIDAYATGHFRALIQAPRGMAEAIGFGPMGEQSRSIEKWISNPATCRIVVVALPEELPVVEALELGQGVKDQLGQQVHFVLNKVWPLSWSAADWEELQTSSDKEGPTELRAFRDLLLESWPQQQSYLAQLRESGASCQSLPWFLEPSSWALMQQLSEQLEEV